MLLVQVCVGGLGQGGLRIQHTQAGKRTSSPSLLSARDCSSCGGVSGSRPKEGGACGAEKGFLPGDCAAAALRRSSSCWNSFSADTSSLPLLPPAQGVIKLCCSINGLVLSMERRLQQSFVKSGSSTPHCASAHLPRLALHLRCCTYGAAGQLAEAAAGSCCRVLLANWAARPAHGQRMRTWCSLPQLRLRQRLCSILCFKHCCKDSAFLAPFLLLSECRCQPGTCHAPATAVTPTATPTSLVLRASTLLECKFTSRRHSWVNAVSVGGMLSYLGKLRELIDTHLCLVMSSRSPDL